LESLEFAEAIIFLRCLGRGIQESIYKIQKDGNMAKEYQVKIVVKAIKKIEEDDNAENRQNENIKPEKTKTREKKHGKK
jgi:hypothetical protein